MLKSVFELSYFIRITFVKQLIFSPLVVTRWLYGCNSWPVLRHLSVVSKKYSFATLANVRQKLWQFKR